MQTARARTLRPPSNLAPSEARDTVNGPRPYMIVTDSVKGTVRPLSLSSPIKYTRML